MTEEIKAKLLIIAKNKGIDTEGVAEEELARKVTGLLYADELLSQENEAKAAWLLPGGIIGHDFSKTSTETQTEPETPEEPAEPETPETPVDPETPETPVDPETPETPAEPETPETPAEGNSTINIEEP